MRHDRDYLSSDSTSVAIAGSSCGSRLNSRVIPCVFVKCASHLLSTTPSLQSYAEKSSSEDDSSYHIRLEHQCRNSCNDAKTRLSIVYAVGQAYVYICSLSACAECVGIALGRRMLVTGIVWCSSPEYSVRNRTWP